MAKKTILIVEDEVPLSRALEKKLQQEGFNVLTAANGEEGLKTSLAEIPDLILLDIVMPVMDGVTMLDKLKKDPEGRRIPVIMLTNLTSSEKLSESQDNGVFGYLIKADWSLDDVLKKINQVFET